MDLRLARGGIWADRAILIGMRMVALVFGAGLVVGGAVWIAQGLNLAWAPRSFMTADRTWIVLGFVAVAVGLATFSRAIRRS
jgi:hypothetical protein